MKKENNWLWIGLIILLFCSGVFYSVVWKETPIMEPDSATYMEVAVDLQDLKIDHIFGRTPGYPLFLLITGSSEVPQHLLFILQIILYEIIVFFITFFLYKQGLDWKFLVPFVILCILPYNMVHTGYVLTETLTIFFLLGGFLSLFFWLRKRQWYLLIMAGIALAFSALIKPTYQLLSVALAATLFIFSFCFSKLKKPLIHAAAVMIASAIIIIGGYVLHNYIQLGYAGLTPDFGFYLSTKTPRVLERLPDEYAEVRDILIKHRDERLLSVEYSHTGYMYIWSALPEIQEATRLSYSELSSYMMKLNLLLIQKAPLNYLQEVTYSISNLLLPSTTKLSDFDSRIIQFIWTALHYLTVVIFIGCCIFIAGALMIFASFTGKSRSQILEHMTELDQIRIVYILLGMILVFYTISISALSDMGVARHRVPVDVIIFSVIWMSVDLWQRMREVMRKSEISFNGIFHFHTPGEHG